MDMKKIGEFLKELRKEKELTQEQLAEILLVSGRTVSRWETGTNMPDLSVLIQMAEFYNLEIREILNGERKGEMMNRELKETLSTVADYNRLEKEKAAKAGNIAFSLTFLICAATIIIQLVITGSLPFVAGETITLLVGGVFYIGTMLHYGIWDNGSGFQSTPSKDILTSAVCSAFFTAALVFYYIRLGAEVSLITPIAILFFVGIAIAGFILLRILAHCSRKRNTESKSAIRSVKSQERQPVNILIADGNMQADMVIETLKENGIPAYKQDLGDAGFAAARYGMGRGNDDRIAVLVACDKAGHAMNILKEMGLNVSNTSN